MTTTGYVSRIDSVVQALAETLSLSLDQYFAHLAQKTLKPLLEEKIHVLRDRDG